MLQDPPGEHFVCGNCGYEKHERMFQRDRCPRCNHNNIWKLVQEPKENQDG